MANQGLQQVFFESVSNVTATASVELGVERWENGSRYVYVYNAGGEDIDPGFGATINSGSTGYSVSVTSVTGNLCIGVAQGVTLTTATYGFLLTKGFADVEIQTTVAIGDNLILGTNGDFTKGITVDTGAIGYPIVGKALEVIATGASGRAYISL